MEQLKGLFDAFYDRLVLRDFFGKIIPGLMLLSAIYICLPATIENTPKLFFVQGISNLGWLAIAGLAWLLSFSVQSFGESVGQSIPYPKNAFSSEGKYFDFKIRFDEVALPGEKTQRERYVVIREACGNGYLAIFISLVLLAMHLGTVYMRSKVVPDETVRDNWIIAVFSIFVLCCLRRSHFILAERQHKYMQAVVSRYNERKNIN